MSDVPQQQPLKAARTEASAAAADAATSVAASGEAEEAPKLNRRQRRELLRQQGLLTAQGTDDAAPSSPEGGGDGGVPKVSGGGGSGGSAPSNDGLSRHAAWKMKKREEARDQRPPATLFLQSKYVVAFFDVFQFLRENGVEANLNDCVYVTSSHKPYFLLDCTDNREFAATALTLDGGKYKGETVHVKRSTQTCAEYLAKKPDALRSQQRSKVYPRKATATTAAVAGRESHPSTSSHRHYSAPGAEEAAAAPSLSDLLALPPSNGDGGDVPVEPALTTTTDEKDDAPAASAFVPRSLRRPRG